MLISREYKRQMSHVESVPYPPSWSLPPSVTDPVSAGVIDEAVAQSLYNLFFLHISPFVCLFDPALHSIDYVRTRSSFLFTVILMASCKFFKPEAFHRCQRLAGELATQALAGDWKSVEVVQAFACLCYWEEPEETARFIFLF